MTRILILAASFQQGGRCVAGKAVDDKRWIRPVLDASGDGVPVACLALNGGGLAVVGDIVEMGLSDQKPESGHQTENRLITGSPPWKKAGRVRYSDLDAYADDASAPLWAGGENTLHGENNCVTAPAKGEGSLRFFRAQNVTVEWVDSDFSARKTPYAFFRTGGADYRMRVTDRRASSPHPWKNGDCRIAECFICASLTQKYSEDSRCHKLVACIIEPERLP